MEGRKFSSSRRVVIYVRDFLSRYDADALRYYIAVAGPETQDTDFTWAEFLNRNNGELVAAWGNLVNRSISMAAKNFGEIPQPGELTDADRALLERSKAAFAAVGAELSRSRFKNAITEAFNVVREANKYLADQAPWKLKDDPDRQRSILLRGAADGRRRQDPAHAVPAELLEQGLQDARRRGHLVLHAGDQARWTRRAAGRTR